MTESLRFVLYPLGLVANLLFSLRFLIQWVGSEKKKKSVVTPLFWKISLSANALLCLHALIQLQYPVCLLQALGAVIAWRNLNLMSGRPTSLKRVVVLMGVTLVSVTALFALSGDFVWMRAPTSFGSSLSWGWHAFGTLGITLFASRFWLQWWLAEKEKKSTLSKPFWWMSLIGALVSVVYFVRLGDLVNVLGYGVGLIPYVRNLMLIKNEKRPLGNSLYLFAGEPSGDVLGSKLVTALQEKSDRPITGVGGPLMRAAGMNVTHPMERFQVMGFSAVIKALPRLYRDFRKITKTIMHEQPAGVVLIDYPEFNMLLARKLRKNGYEGQLIHYVCPSVWAWRKNRVHTLAKSLDRLLAILPFEEKCFEKTSLPVTFVGHPLVAAIDSYTYDDTLELPEKVLAIFPGSRRHEIELNLPIQWAAAKKMPGYTPVISVARPELMDEIKKHVDDSALFVPQDKRYELMRAADLALATSGTIVLEMGLHAVPTVITYQLATFNYLLGRYAFRILLPFYTLVNIICEKEVYPEFIHKDLNINAIVAKLRAFEENPEPCKKACEQLRTRLSENNASSEAAKTILSSL